MADNPINTVTGTISPDQLGRTLMHEHLLISYPGASSDTLRPGANRAEAEAICIDRVEEIKAEGVVSMIDPCPNDLGRDIDLMVRVAEKTGFQIVCATGLYKEDEGGAPYWKFRANFGAGPESIAELFVKELTEGIGTSGVKAGIIKIATGAPAISDYERSVLEAAAIASLETGAPITTHTDQGLLGDEQQAYLTGRGVPANRIIVGHCCGSSDFDYHMAVVSGGSYLGFDRFGLEILQPDAVRIASMCRLIEAGCASRIVVSHDTVWCWGGQPIPDPRAFESLLEIWQPTHFFKRVIPRLEEKGVTTDQIAQMLDENPRRFFAGEELPELG
ncbi:MAG: phosphotriesterase [Candidatus Binatia bacterium]